MKFGMLIDELLDALLDMVQQDCTVKDDGEEDVYLDSMAISTYATAMRLLARYGKIEIIDDAFRRVMRMCFSLLSSRSWLIAAGEFCRCHPGSGSSLPKGT